MNKNYVKQKRGNITLRSALLVLFAHLLVITGAFAQRTVTGTVTDDSSVGFPGVNVIVKGTSTGTLTDFDGVYSINVPSDNSILVFSYLGYKTQEVEVGGRIEINIGLIADVSALDEVVVVGYGTQSKRNITGSVASVDLKEAGILPNVNVTQSLSMVSGVQFTGSGRPGQDGGVLIRGQNSLSAQNYPLIVLDGIVFNGSLSDINPQDIASMDILKDASSASIYGSRAANGVILITSKKGTTEKPTVRLNMFSGLSDWASEIKLLSPERYIQRRLDYRKQAGLPVDADNVATYFMPNEAYNIENGISNNAWKVASQQGMLNSIDLSVSGREKSISYYLSSSLSDERGLIYNDNQRRNTFRANVSSQVAEWLTIGMDATFSHRDLSGTSAKLRGAYESSPYGTFYYPDGIPTQYPVPDEQAVDNPVYDAFFNTNSETYDNLFSNFYTVFDIPFVKGLSYRINYSPNVGWHHDYNFVRQDKNLNFNNTSASKFNEQSFQWVLENIVTYKNKIGENHAFDFTFLFGRDHSEKESTMANSDLLSFDALGYNDLGLGSIMSNSSNAEEVEGISYMGRLNYLFMKKYLLTMTVRRDGSSVFSKNNKYATFPSGALAWIVSDEAFMENVKFIDNMKLRLSYGAVGNQAIEPYQSLSLSDTERYVLGNPGASVLGVVNSTLGNDDLKWETTYTFNAAIDFELFNRRLGGTLEFYNSDTENLLVRRTIPAMNGYTSVLTNIGQTNNRGIEVSLNSMNVQTDRFQWSTSINFSHNKNKIVRLFGTDIDNDGKEDDSVSNSWFIGQPINSYYDYVFDGIYQEGDTDIPVGSQPGFVRVKDMNGDGKIGPDDRRVVGHGVNPEYSLGMRNIFSYGNLSLSISMNSMLNWVAPFNLINPRVPGRAFNALDSGYWTPENRSNSRPSLIYSNPLATNWYVSRDFVRIKDVSLSYDFDKAVLDKISMSKLQLFISVKNLHTWTNWMGSDPESGGSYLTQQGSEEMYPMPRTFAMGINIAF